MLNHVNIMEPSEALLLAVKKQEPVDFYLNILAKVDYNCLVKSLNTNNKKKAFWINIYNAQYQLLKSRYNVSDKKIYTTNKFEIGGLRLSLDDIEHGILRKYRYKYSMGYFKSPFVPKYIKALAIILKELRFVKYYA